MAKTQVTQAQIIQALTETGGIVSNAATQLDMTPQGLRKRVASNESIQTALEEIREQTKDLAEGVIIRELKAGDKDTARWYLASQARDRGFGNKVEVDGKVKIEKEVDLSGLSLEELKKLEEIANKVTGNSDTD